jgi:hypothetical protein
MTERREFQMDKNLLVDVIKRQAGSLQKAVLEGVMNSIEAGATAETGGVQVTLDSRQLIISDGGRGFRNRKEIEDWFETFGKPHEKSEGKVWAQFRMGRGQLMAFGRNLWNSNEFQMDVDIDNKGLGYDLSEVKKFDGCRVQVDLYRALNDSEIWSTSREIERAVKFVEVPVFVNGKQVNTPASESKWDNNSTDEAHFKLEASETRSVGIEVYNLGVYVMTIPRYTNGVGGTIVSKVRLDVNFARNDVIRSCPIWRKIQKVINSCSTVKRVSRKRKLTSDERTSLIHKFIAGEMVEGSSSGDRAYRNWSTIPLLLDASGHAWSATSLGNNTKFGAWTVGPADIPSDKMIQQRICLVFDEDIIREFSYPGEESGFLEWFIQAACCGIAKAAGIKKESARPRMNYSSYSKVLGGVDLNHYLIPNEEWSKSERRWVKAIEMMSDCFWGEYRKASKRTINVGKADSALAWTNGLSYVTFEKRYLQSNPLIVKDRPKVKSIVKIAQTLAHEYCHDGDSTTQRHTPEFYRAYHDASDMVAQAVSSVVAWFSSPANQQEMDRRIDKEIEREKARAKKKADALKKKKKVKKKIKKVKEKTEVKEEEKIAAKTDGEMSQEQEAYESYRGNGGSETWKAIETRMGLRPANGMSAVRLSRKWAKKLEKE